MWMRVKCGGPSCHMSGSDRLVGSMWGPWGECRLGMVVFKCLPFIWNIPNGGYRV